MSIMLKGINMPKGDKPLSLEIYADGHIWINWGPEYERKDNAAIQVYISCGEWIDDAGGLKCSVCGESFPDLFPLYDKAKYCPNCGATMEANNE